MDHPKEDHKEREFKPWIIGRILDLTKKFSKQEKHPYKLSKIKYIGINTEGFENILWSNSSIQIWSINKDWKTGYVIEISPTEKVV